MLLCTTTPCTGCEFQFDIQGTLLEDGREVVPTQHSILTIFIALTLVCNIQLYLTSSRNKNMVKDNLQKIRDPKFKSVLAVRVQRCPLHLWGILRQAKTNYQSPLYPPTCPQSRGCKQLRLHTIPSCTGPI